MSKVGERTYTTMAGKSIGQCASGHWLPLRGPCDLCGADYDEKCRYVSGKHPDDLALSNGESR
jgi:hypothetical protein